MHGPQTLSQPEHRPATTALERFGAGIDDLIILPLVTIVYAIRKLLQAIFTVLVDLIDWLFPILLQLMRFPLFTLRILGDAMAALIKGVVRFLPVGGTRRAAWREFVSRHWAWIRQKISYKAFEEALHHAFEGGMAWMFRKCRSLTPGAALLVLAGAILWLPISFAVATLMHAVLFAKALVWPAWVQLLHPVATVIAKSKLLVLPVYPASWPQAKQHPLVQALIRFWRYLATLYLVRKTGFRYRQVEQAGTEAAAATERAAASSGLTGVGSDLLAVFNRAAFWVGRTARAIATRSVAVLANAPLLGRVVERYVAHYDVANREPSAPLSERVSGFYARWSTKFTAEYYEAKERDEAAKNRGAAPI